MNENRAFLLAALLLAVVPHSIGAHDGHVHTVMGIVMGVGAQTVQVKTPGGETLAIGITEKTTVVRGKQRATIAEVRKGTRVVVDIGNGEDPLIANEIRLGAAVPAQK